MYSICTYRSMCLYQVEYGTIINPVPLICKYFFLLFGFIGAFVWLYWCFCLALSVHLFGFIGAYLLVCCENQLETNQVICDLSSGLPTE